MKALDIATFRNETKARHGAAGVPGRRGKNYYFVNWNSKSKGTVVYD
jgi:hypothetical protein